jgi:deoxyhypusine synthase
MVKDKECVKFLALGGTMIPGGMRNVIAEMLRNDLVDAEIVLNNDILCGLKSAVSFRFYRDGKRFIRGLKSTDFSSALLRNN